MYLAVKYLTERQRLLLIINKTDCRLVLYLKATYTANYINWITVTYNHLVTDAFIYITFTDQFVIKYGSN
jgi:hypothetical protein